MSYGKRTRRPLILSTSIVVLAVKTKGKKFPVNIESHARRGEHTWSPRNSENEKRDEGEYVAGHAVFLQVSKLGVS